MATRNYAFYCKIYTSSLHYIVVSCDCYSNNWNWFCLMIFRLSCELALLNCLHLYKGWLSLHKTHELCVATYACLVCLLMLLLLLVSLGCLLARISSRAWHLPSRKWMSSSSSVTPCVTAFISHCFLVNSSTCSVSIWDDNTSCKGMPKSNALTAFKLLWNWVITALKSVADSVDHLVTMTSHELQLLNADYMSHSKFQATWKFCSVTGSLYQQMRFTG